MYFENLNERMWERIRKNTKLPLKEAIRYWALGCEMPW